MRKREQTGYFNPSLLEEIGFNLLGQDESLVAKFTRIDVFSVQGIFLSEPYTSPTRGSINEIPFRMSFGTSVNRACTELTGSKFAEDEEKLKRDTESNLPFLVLALGPTRKYCSFGVYYKVNDDEIITYDGFRDAELDLKERFDTVSPVLLMSLALSFASEGWSVRFDHRKAAVQGETDDGKRISDFRAVISGGTIGPQCAPEESVGRLSKLACENAKALDMSYARFFYFASNEKDPLKRFLNYFLCVERLINLTFTEMDHRAAVSGMFADHSNIEASAHKLLGDHRNSWKDLRNRFIWCAMHKWTHLNDVDVEQFTRLKNVRDDIAHGKVSMPSHEDVNDIEALALRMLSSPLSGASSQVR